ncbi:uncharacterized protein KY384_006115 [Bacidia gigantensis]|uniref:uncharacterized protein n=1 Tax=Bacidia gigantensis TaxID=2732470 RepID=UPI001D03ACEE|nr:uncharacterized protein KY384_006115 [Bacidia gigantensis]KAG8529478.1 hypothetical protein KY384_006115 [Bacidia gigantensis]
MLYLQHLTTVITLSSLFACSTSAPTSSGGTLLVERLGRIPQGWEQGRAPGASEQLRFRIAIKQDNAFDFEQHVLAISDPDHPKYGQHMKRDELKDMLRPSPDASSAILEWLRSEGVSERHIQDDGDWINFYVPTTEAERILHTKFYYYHNKAADIDRIRTLQYSVPPNVHQYVQMIQPTTRFGQMQPEKSTVYEHFVIGDSAKQLNQYQSPNLNVTLCNTTITPQCLRDLYQIGDARGSAENGGSIGIAGYLKEYAKFDDFRAFTEEYAPYAADENFTYVLINGGLDTQEDTVDDDVEANLDVQYAYPLSYPTPGIYYSTGGLGELVPDLDQPTLADNQNEPYLDFLHYILSLSDDDLPTTLTTSYGEDEQSVPESYSNTTCSLFAQLGARGVSVLFSSGDTGPGSACQTNDGKNTTRFLPIFPAACPFVTSVGGTVNVEPEKAVSFSSGGFSDRFPRPSYQDQAVTQFLEILGDTWKGLYNPNGRGFPDVAAQGRNFKVIDQGKEILVGGTSASSPTFAGVVSLLNSARLSEGRKPLGFLNPFIYKYGYKGLTDIVDGSSKGCTGKDIYSGLPTPFVPGAGWAAVKGWGTFRVCVGCTVAILTREIFRSSDGLRDSNLPDSTRAIENRLVGNTDRVSKVSIDLPTRSAAHVGKKLQNAPPRIISRQTGEQQSYAQVERRAPTENASKFSVDGTGIPDVPFDIGESYAGLLPISSDSNETRQLYFWYFPSGNPAAEDEITIWLNGGPGCSSLEGLLQENGPFLWQYGTFAPVKNPWTWVNLTSVVWVEQPVGTGFSQGDPSAKDETDVAKQFLGFFKNFLDTFGLHNKKVYITGESYAGYYVPYIADAMLNTNDTKYYDVNGIIIYDPSTDTDAVQEQIPAVAYTDAFAPLFSLNASFTSYIHSQAETCGYTEYLNKYLVFPPPGPLPNPPMTKGSDDPCDIWNAILNAVSLINPCFDIYQIATTCPLLWDVLGFPGSFDYLPDGAEIYFNRSDVQKAINAPLGNWEECTSKDVFVGDGDQSPPSGLSILPSVIERLNKTIIAHGALDYILIANGTLLMIQNMTWNGAQGFQAKPQDEFYVPYHTLEEPSTLAGAGVFGTTHTERGLTWVEVSLSGHMVPQYAPSAAYRQLEFLLGRIGSLSEVSSFTTDPDGANVGVGGGNSTMKLL